MKRNNFYWLAICLLIMGCHRGIDARELSRLEQSYSPDIINYFFETAFNPEEDGDEAPAHYKKICKWKEDIHFIIQGDTIPGDGKRVLDAVEQLNNLKLPVRLIETFRADKASLMIKFGAYKDLYLSKGAIGTATYYMDGDYINNALVKMPLDTAEQSTTGLTRAHVILKLIAQMMGLADQSYSYSNSVFYENRGYSPYLDDRDKQALHFLYDAALPAGYSHQRFVESFGDILYPVNGKKKFLAYIRAHRVEKTALGDIDRSGMIDEKIVKYSFPAYLRLSGDLTPADEAQAGEVAKEINTVSKNLELQLVGQDTLVSEGGIHIRFIKDQTQRDLVVSKVSTTTVSHRRFPRRIVSQIDISYRDSLTAKGPVRPDQLIDLLMANAVYQSVCLFDTENALPYYSFEYGRLHLRPYYHDLLGLYYNDSLPGGFGREELRECLENFK